MNEIKFFLWKVRHLHTYGFLKGRDGRVFCGACSSYFTRKVKEGN